MLFNSPRCSSLRHKNCEEYSASKWSSSCPSTCTFMMFLSYNRLCLHGVTISSDMKWEKHVDSDCLAGFVKSAKDNLRHKKLQKVQMFKKYYVSIILCSYSVSFLICGGVRRMRDHRPTHTGIRNCCDERSGGVCCHGDIQFWWFSSDGFFQLTKGCNVSVSVDHAALLQKVNH